jgi:hypothetical protein
MMADSNKSKLIQLNIPTPPQLFNNLKSIANSSGTSVQEIAITAMTSYVLNEKRIAREERLRKNAMKRSRINNAGLKESNTTDSDSLDYIDTLAYPDYYQVISKVPNAIICLISALCFHHITDQIPHEVQFTLASGSKKPIIDYPPTRVFWFSGKALTAGVETHILDGRPVKIYSAAKTVADCFKYRNKVGLDVALEALRMYLYYRRGNVGELMEFAKICRVYHEIMPYTMALLS